MNTMSLIPALLLGCSLALDCFAIAISQGIRSRKQRPLLILALLFGLFQGGMLLLGDLASSLVSGLFSRGMDFVAAALLIFIGIKMLRESREEADGEAAELGEMRDYLVLSLATSIDALAGGFSLASLGIGTVLAVTATTLFSFGLALLGGLFGSALGAHFGKQAELFGGIVLIALGIKAAWG